MLDALGIQPHQVDDAILTHLDSDHFHPGWLAGGPDKRGAMPAHVRVRLHTGHARRLGVRFPHARLLPFDREFTIQSGALVRPLLLSHDDEGVAAFRIDTPPAMPPAGADHTTPALSGVEPMLGGSLGFATDLGRATPELINLFGSGPRPVDVLAIESNYCPRLQAASGRPDFLIHRITGGHGHLSNHQAAEAIRQIDPREHVVLLHLSQQCNQVSLVAALHEGADYHMTIASQHTPTRWIPIRPPSTTLPPSLVEIRSSLRVVAVSR